MLWDVFMYITVFDDFVYGFLTIKLQIKTFKTNKKSCGQKKNYFAICYVEIFWRKKNKTNTYHKIQKKKLIEVVTKQRERISKK